MKRAMDILLSVFGLVLLSPLLLALSVIAGFYIQERIGRHGRPFRMLKFRTMVKNAEKMGMAITVDGDARITSLGRILRKTKLDELPQLWNVLKGEMSFVGPRPEVAKYVDLYSPDQRLVLELRPGITDLASIGYFNESEMLKGSPDPETFYTGHIMPDKIRINLEYAGKAGPVVDLLLIIFTVLRPFGVKPNLFAWLDIAPP